MNPALAYLLLRSMRGRIVRALRLLKQPKYLVGILGFVFWIGFWVIWPLFLDNDDGEVNVEYVNAELMYDVMGDALPAIETVVALAIAVFLTLWWLVPWSKMALNLNEAEIHMLTPMPVRRRHLIQYATLKSQPGILFGCFMLTLFLGGGGPLDRLWWFAAFWIFLSIWDLHSKGRALWLARQKEMPAPTAWRNRALLVGGLILFWLIVGSALFAVVDGLLDAASARSALGDGNSAPGVFDGCVLDDFETTMSCVRQTLAHLGTELRTGALGWALAPLRWLSAPFFSAAPSAPPYAWLTSLLVPLLTLILHNEWVVRSQAQFEEAALAHARREASKQKPAARYWKRSLRSRQRVPFRLAPRGAPELGVLWKNTMIVSRLSLKKTVGLGLAAVVVAATLPFVLNLHEAVFFMLMLVGLMTMLFSPLAGAQSYRNDLRADLLRVEMVRPWPIEGWKLFAAEAAGPALFGTLTAAFGAALFLAVYAGLVFSPTPIAQVTIENFRITPDGTANALGVPQPLLVPLIVLAAMPLVLALTCLSAALQNLVVLMFPGWMHLGSEKNQGAAAFGQNMVTIFGLSLASFLCLLPAAIIVGVVLLAQWFIFGIPLIGWELPIFGVIAALPVFAAAALIVRAGGRVWTDLDPSREVLEGSA